MAATVSEYLVKAASFCDGSKKFKEKLRVLGDQYDTLSGFKSASVDFLVALRNAEGNPLIRPFTEKETVHIPVDTRSVIPVIPVHSGCDYFD